METCMFAKYWLCVLIATLVGTDTRPPSIPVFDAKSAWKLREIECGGLFVIMETSWRRY